MSCKQLIAGVIASLLAILAAPVFSGTGQKDAFEVVRQGIFHDALYDICFEGNNGLALGYTGVLLESNDTGKSWAMSSKIQTPLTLLGASCDGAKRIIVGQQGAIFVEGADSWVSVNSGIEERLLAVDMNRQGVAVAVGAFGTVLLSQDSGESWKPLVLDWEALINDFLEPHLYDVNVDEAGVITFVGEFALIARSTDGGESWQVVNKGDPALFSLHLDDSGLGFAVGQTGLVLKTVDGGVTWQSIETEGEPSLLSVWNSAQGEVIAVGMRSLMRSSDGASTWRASDAGRGDVPTTWYQALAAGGEAGQEKVYMVGHSGRIIQLTQ